MNWAEFELRNIFYQHPLPETVAQENTSFRKSRKMRMIMRKDTGQEVGVVTNRYKVVQHWEIEKAMITGLEKVAYETDLRYYNLNYLDIPRMKETAFGVCGEGAIWEIPLTKHESIEYKGQSDRFRSSIRIVNKINGASGIKAIPCTMREVCSNGMWAMSYGVAINIGRHTTGYKATDMAGKLALAIGSLTKVYDKYMTWASTKDLLPKDLADGLLQFYGGFSKLRKGDTIDHIIELQFPGYGGQDKIDLWQLFNSLTFYIEHGTEPTIGAKSEFTVDKKMRMYSVTDSLMGDALTTAITGSLPGRIQKKLGYVGAVEVKAPVGY